MLRKIQIALYDKDGYMSSLIDYLCRKGHSMIETRLFTEVAMLQKFAENGRIDVLLAGEEAVSEVCCLKSRISQIILLSEENQAGEQSEFFRIFKYQSAQCLVKEVLAQIAEDDSICCIPRQQSDRTVELIGVFAPFGGAGATEYALSLAGEYVKQYKTLYISMELFQGLDFVLNARKEQETSFYRGMSEVIFYLKQRKDKLALKLESIVVSVDALDYIFAVEDYRDLYSLSSEDIKRLLKALLRQTEYEKILFDIGYMGDATLYLLEQCDQLYMPEAVSRTQRSKEQAFFRFLQREDCERLSQRFQRIGRREGRD